jgi:hypothetical protein
MVSAAAIMPENLPGAWSDGATTALAIATALSQQASNTLPWKTVRDVIGGALQARFVSLADDSAPWPCELPAAQTIRLKMVAGGVGKGEGGGGAGGGGTQPGMLVASAEFEPSQIQDLADAIPQLLAFKAKAKLPLRFHVRIEVGDGTQKPSAEAAAELNALLNDLKDGLQAE